MKVNYVIALFFGMCIGIVINAAAHKEDKVLKEQINVLSQENECLKSYIIDCNNHMKNSEALIDMLFESNPDAWIENQDSVVIINYLNSYEKLYENFED